MYDTQKNQIAQLNDTFRKEDFSLGLVSLSPKVESLPETEKRQLLSALRQVDNYIEHPNVTSLGWHDFGIVTVDETDYIWEIDYYDTQQNTTPQNLADPTCTTRTLTVVRTDEY